MISQLLLIDHDTLGALCQTEPMTRILNIVLIGSEDNNNAKITLYLVSSFRSVLLVLATFRMLIFREFEIPQTPVSGPCCLPLGALQSMWAT